MTQEKEKMPDPIVTTYEPDNSLKKGFLSMTNEIRVEILKNRWLILQLFKRDLLSTYKQSFIGVFWVLLLPLFSVLTFIALNRSGIFAVGRLNMPYPLFAVQGLVFWQAFSTGLLAASFSLVKAGSMVVKINFSKKSLVIASAGQALIPLAVLTALSLGLCFVYHHPPRLWILALPILILPLLLLMLGLGLVFALLNGIMRDIGNILSILMTFMLFLTPILYPPPTRGGIAKITRFNPLHYLISLPRDLILTGKSALWPGFGCSALFSLLLFFLCLIVFHLAETRVAERV